MKRIEQVINLLNVPVVFFDQFCEPTLAFDPDGQLVYCNPAAKKRYELEENALQNRSWGEICACSWQDPHGFQEQEAALANMGHWHGLQLHQLPDGRCLQVEAYLFQLRDENEQLIGQLAIYCPRPSTGKRVAACFSTESLDSKPSDSKPSDSKPSNPEQQLLLNWLHLRERERNYVSTAIHDRLLQYVIGAQLLLESLAGKIQDAGGQPASELDRSLQMLRTAIDEGRRLIDQQCPLVVEEQGLLSAIEYLLVDLHEQRGCAIAFDSQVEFERLAPIVESILFRIVQEAVLNIIQHSQSDSASVQLRQSGDHLHLVIEDNGVGFDPDQVGPGCWGLQGMSERVRVLGGAIKVESVPGAGMRIIIDLPLQPF